MKRMVLAVLLFSGTLLHADLKRAMAEPNLEKRSGLALDNATAALKSARAAYDNGDNDEVAKDVAEVLESVELAATSLARSGKNPRRSDWFNCGRSAPSNGRRGASFPSARHTGRDASENRSRAARRGCAAPPLRAGSPVRDPRVRNR